jgi:hypothetical protein
VRESKRSGREEERTRRPVWTNWAVCRKHNAIDRFIFLPVSNPNPSIAYFRHLSYRKHTFRMLSSVISSHLSLASAWLLPLLLTPRAYPPRGYFQHIPSPKRALHVVVTSTIFPRCVPLSGCFLSTKWGQGVLFRCFQEVLSPTWPAMWLLLSLLILQAYHLHGSF